MSVIDTGAALGYCEGVWDASIVSTLSEYIAIPNASPDFDPEWETNGHMDAAMELLVNWVKAQEVAGLEMRVVREAGRTPVLFATVAASEGYGGDSTVLLYGHMDKQPPMTESWSEGLHPYTPVIRGDKLYGRGGADDGYAIFCAITAIKALQAQGAAHARYVIFIEASEESGSPDLPYYVQNMMEEIGSPDLIVCLDSGCGNYDQLWTTSSLRGVINLEMRVSLLSEGVHSGAGSGIVASSFRVARMLLARLEDVETGALIGDVFKADIPPARMEQARKAAEVLGETVYSEMPLRDGATPVTDDIVELYLNKSWRATLSVTGADGLPASAIAGNVLRSFTTLKLSFRLPPTADPAVVREYVVATLTENPPYGAHVSVTGEHGGSGWNAPEEKPYLIEAVDGASNAFYGNPAMSMGEGGSIPFMGMLGELFPAANFFITGVLGPKSNAHGPDEFIHIPFAKRLTASVAYVLAAHAVKPADQ